MRPLIASLMLFASLSLQAQTSTVTIEIDAAKPVGSIRDVFGTNRKPTASNQAAATGQAGGTTWNGSNLYSAFGLTQVRTHDTGVDLCSTYTAATKTNAGVSPTQPVTGCSLSGTSGRPHFTWTPTSSADADLNNPNNYDFSSVDEAISAALSSGAAIYLRLGESYNGPNDTNDPVAWAKVATNIYKHVIGVFKPSTGIAVDPVFVEIHNEPDGAFWAGSTTTFNSLFTETAQRVRAAAAAAGRTVKVGGAGFTTSVLTSSTRSGNPANGFISAVGASTLDFYSAHHYNSCASATLGTAASFLRSLRSHVNSQGGSSKPIHITEWNIGLGEQCGESLYSGQRTQSFDSGVLTLFQDPAQNIEAAHFYAAMPLMSLFNFTANSGKVRINPAAWAFWAHNRLKGGSLLSAQICPQGGSCINGYAAESAALMALAAQTTGGQRIVVTNDSANSVTYTLRIKGLSGSNAVASISTPPAGTRDLSTTGTPASADSSELNALLAAVSKESKSLTLSGGSGEFSATIPAYTLQLVEVNPALPAATSDSIFNWAERAFPQYFAPAASSASYQNYYYRYYARTGNYLATSSLDNYIWLLGPVAGNTLLKLAPAADFLSTAGCAN